MTDKQIIIDGVDVSGCPHIEYEHKWWDMAGREHNSENVCSLSFDNNADFEEDFLCEQNPNCYYKQLKRSEAQCEAMFVSHTDLEKKYKAKEQECEELKRQHQGDKGLITSTGKMNYQLLQEYDKLKNCLTEIKEIAEHCIKQDICTTCDNSDKCHIEDEEIPTYDVCKLILQKISECEGNND